MNKEELENRILEAKKTYYSGYPIMTDAQYDALENTLQKKYPDSNVLQIVGYIINKNNRIKVKHDKPMLSLAKEKTETGLYEFLKPYDEILCTFKMDGSSGSLIYENGKFFQAKTRGNGQWGEVFTKHAEFINFPKEISIKEKVEIRGEVLITYENFELLKEEIKKLEQDVPDSHRNVVSGLLHRKENLDLCKFLSFVAYEVINNDFKTKSSKLVFLKNSGFEIPKHCLFFTNDFNKIFPQIVSSYEKYIESKKYLTDGLVFSVNDCLLHEQIGYTSHHPKFEIAYKFQSETAVTKIKDIEIGIGKTGKITFVGIVEPVELSGCIINRVTLHNVAYIKEHQLNKGALIEITRSNEVIPKHVSTLESEGDYEFPVCCPCCNSKLILTETETDLVCDNDLCETKIFNRIMNWIDTVEIFHLAEANLLKMKESGFVNEISDLYNLTKEKLLTLEGFKEGLSDKILESINQTKNTESYKILAGLGINGVGIRMSKLILEKYESIENLIKQNKESDFLNDIKGIGPKIKEKIQMFFSNQKMMNEITKILENVSEIKQEKRQGVLTNKIVAITGTLSRPRKQIEKDIEEAGGKNSGSISSTTAFLVANEISNSSKFVAANKFNVKIISEQELYEILGK